MRGRESSTKAVWQNDGWEFVTQSEGLSLRREMTFRRVKPEPSLKVDKRVWIGLGVLIAVGILLASGGTLEGRDTPKPNASPSETTAAAPSEKPSEEPSAEPSQEPSQEPTKEPSKQAPRRPVTDAEVVDAFRMYLDERAAADVTIAKAVTDVSFSERVVRVTFDPAAAGLDQATFDQRGGSGDRAVLIRWHPG